MKKIAIFAAVMVIGAGVALASTLNVPFFLDNQSQNNGSSGVVGRIGIKESSGSAQTLTVVYTALDASDNPTDQTVTFALGANQQIRWNPVQDNSAESAAGGAIGNMTIQNSNGNNRTAGSARVFGTGALTGVYGEIDLARGATSLHVLRPN